MNLKLTSMYRYATVLTVVAKNEAEEGLTKAEQDILTLASKYPTPANHDQVNVVFAAAPEDPVNPTYVSDLIDLLTIAMPDDEQPTPNQIAEIVGKELVKPERLGPVIFTRPNLTTLHGSDVWKLWCGTLEQDEVDSRCDSLREMWPDVPVGMSAVEARGWIYGKLGGVA